MTGFLILACMMIWFSWSHGLILFRHYHDET